MATKPSVKLVMQEQREQQLDLALSPLNSRQTDRHTVKHIPGAYSFSDAISLKRKPAHRWFRLLELGGLGGLAGRGGQGRAGQAALDGERVLVVLLCCGT
jgi:hypothetical protein